MPASSNLCEFGEDVTVQILRSWKVLDVAGLMSGGKDAERLSGHRSCCRLQQQPGGHDAVSRKWHVTHALLDEEQRASMPSDADIHELQRLASPGHSADDAIGTEAVEEEDEVDDEAEMMAPSARNDVAHHDNSNTHPRAAAANDDDQEAVALIEPSRRRTSESVKRSTVRKLDTILLPFLALLFLLNSLDKSNIGNAETAGFTNDTGLSRSDVNTCMAVFFFVFVLLQPVGAALGRKFGMRRYVPACMSLWGLSTILHIFVRRRWHLIVLRIAIATLESGFYPTTVSYMSLFYTKYEFAFRLGFFYGMTAVAGVLGGILSWAVFSHFPGHDDPDRTPQPPSLQPRAFAGGWKSWEILFLIEGCLTMTIALIGFFWLPHSADSAWFFTADERAWAEQRMQTDTLEIEKPSKSPIDPGHTPENATGHLTETTDDREPEEGTGVHDRLLTGREAHNSIPGAQRSSITEDSGLTKQDVLLAVFNYKIWHLLIVNILSAIPATAFGVLLPIVVKELSPSLNLSPAASNLLSAPPFAFGALVLFAFTIWSDRSRKRLLPILCGLVVLAVGLALAVALPVNSYWLRYLSLCVLLSGSYIASPLTVAWLANNTPEPGKRAILLGINGWGNLAGVFIEVLFTRADEENGYIRSFIVLLICVLISFSGFVAFRIYLARENHFRYNVVRNWGEEETAREEMLGDVPAPESTTQRLARKVGLLALATKLGLEEGRRGDDKLTYRYSF